MFIPAMANRYFSENQCSGLLALSLSLALILNLDIVESRQAIFYESRRAAISLGALFVSKNKVVDRFNAINDPDLSSILMMDKDFISSLKPESYLLNPSYFLDIGTLKIYLYLSH